MTERTAKFLIIAGAITAFGLPVALAFPPSFVLKVAATAALVALACGIAALIMRMRRSP